MCPFLFPQVLGYMVVKSTEYVKWSKLDDERDIRYPRYVWYFLAVCFALLILLRILNAIDRELIKKGKDRSPGVARVVRVAWNKYVGYVTLPYVHFNFGDLLLITLYSVVIVTLCFNDTPDSPAPIHYGYANRSGIITFATLPFVIALSGRNNVVSFLLGIPYERLRIYHFWTSRLTLFSTLVHTIGRLRISTAATWTKATNIWGLVGFIAACLLFLGTFPFIMKSRYEVFFAIHAVVVILYFVGSWIHQPDNRGWLYASIAVWALDRALRIVRTVGFNGVFRSKEHRPSEARIWKVSDDTVRIELHRPDFPSWKPGSHAFLTGFGLHWFPQGHPFTIASIPEPLLLSGDEPASPSCSEDDEKNLEKRSSNSHGDQIFWDSKTLVFIVRARDGWTKHLANFATSREEGQTLDLLVDGPYSSPESISHYGQVILFAGGSGVSWTLPLLLDLVALSQKQTLQVKLKRVVWIWIIKDSSHLAWIEKELLVALRCLEISSLNVEIQVISTNSRVPSEKGAELNSSELLLSTLEAFDSFKCISSSARPDVAKLLRDSVPKSREGRIFVGSSGPSQMSESLRSEARQLMGFGEGGLDITFKAEEFGW